MTSHDVNGKVFAISRKGVIGSYVRSLTVHACSLEAIGVNMNVFKVKEDTMNGHGLTN